MSMPSKVVVLFDQTSAANTTLNTGELNTASIDALLCCIVFSAAASGAPSIALSDFSTGVQLMNDPVAATAVNAVLGYGPAGGTVGDTAAGYAPAAGAILPPSTRVVIGAAGAGVTTRLVIYGRRNHRGPDVSDNPD